MKFKLINIADATYYPAPRDLTPEEEAAIIAQYKAERTPEAIEADYQDFEKQVAEGISAEEFIRELEEDLASE